MTTNQPPRIALIAIHGVGEHAPSETARAAAEALMSDASGAYAEEADVSLILAPVADAPKAAPAALRSPGGMVSSAPAATPAAPAAAAATATAAVTAAVTAAAPNRESWRDGVDSPFWSEQAGPRAARRVEAHAASPAPGRAATAAALDIDFSASLLEKGESDRKPYKTLRVRLRRGPRANGEREAFVDVHELHWADLSRASNAGWSVARDLVQLVAHLASLGRTLSAIAAVASARAGTGAAVRWERLYHVQKWSYFLFSIPIIVWNLLLAAVVFLLLPAMVPDGAQRALAVGLAAPTVLVWLGYRRLTWLWRPTDRAGGIHSGTLELLGGTAIAAALAFVVSGYLPGHVAVWLAEAPAVAMLYALLLRSYDSVRPGAYTFGMASLAVAAVGVGVLAWIGRNEASPAIWVTLRGAELVFIAEGVAWTLLWGLDLFALIAGLIILRDRHPADRQTVRTVLLASSLSPSLFILVLLTVWAMAIPALGHALHVPADFAYRSLLQLSVEHVAPVQLAQLLLDAAAGKAFPPFLGLLGLGALIAAWGVLPGLLLEFMSGPRGDAATGVSSTLGRRLTLGLDAITRSLWLVWIAFMLVLPLGCLMTYVSRLYPALWWHDDLPGFSSLGIVLGGATIGLTALSGRLSAGFDKLRTLVDVALDIDNWLRERPKASTPRFNIFDRLDRLLHHLLKAGAERAEPPVDAIVIVAHSQGTVVAADLLRYLASRRRDTIGRVPVFLCTVGSPLRQLYATRLGGLYTWVGSPDGRHTGEPDPATLGVRAWINGYYSGDYVGRALWEDPLREETYHPPVSPQAARARVAAAVSERRGTDVCFGAGAHTHYFDGENPLVFAVMDELIGRAVAAVPPRASAPVAASAGSDAAG